MPDNDSEAEQWLSGLADAIYGVMKPLVSPLVDRWNSITGDADLVHDTAGKWQAMADGMRNVATYERTAADATLEGWIGLSGDAYRSYVHHIADQMDEIAGQMKGVRGFLDSAAKEVQEVEDLCRDLIYELIEWAALSLVIGAVGAIVTFGASAAAGAAVAAGKAGTTGAKIANLLRKVAVALKRIAELIKAYQRWVKKLPFKWKMLYKAGVQKPLLKAATDLDGDFKTPLIGLAEVKYDITVPTR